MTELSHLVERGGLGSVGKRLHDGQPVTVAYLGGSITQAGAAPSEPTADGKSGTSYRNRTTAWLRQTFLGVAVREIQAGIGGTASDLGAFRLERDVLQYQPDLLFVEFAVNDGGLPDELILRTMEGIVRHARQGDNCPDICFIYTLSQTHLPDYEQGQLPRTVRLHEQVAEHYGIPSINVALPVAWQLAEGTLRWDEFSGDSCHPTEMGHGLYGATIAEALTRLFVAAPARSSLPRPLTACPLEQGQMIPVLPADVAAGWNYRPLENRGGWQCFDGVLESDTPGAEVVLTFRGSTLGLFYLLGPETGDMLVAIDDESFKPLSVWDEYAEKFWRPHYRILTEGLCPGAHQLRIRVAEEAQPRSQGRWTKLAYLLCVGDQTTA